MKDQKVDDRVRGTVDNLVSTTTLINIHDNTGTKSDKEHSKNLGQKVTLLVLEDSQVASLLGNLKMYNGNANVGKQRGVDSQQLPSISRIEDQDA